jgi:hypothetical protein
MTRQPMWACMAAAISLAACTPTLNWREVRPEGSDALMMFPCKPDRLARPVHLAGEKVRMQLSSCTVQGVTYALSHAAVDQPAKVTPALQALQAAAAQNIGARPGQSMPVMVSGMTPNALAQRLDLHGEGPDGKPVAEQVAVFARGLRVYQLTIVGSHIDAEAADIFFSGIKLSP